MKRRWYSFPCEEGKSLLLVLFMLWNQLLPAFACPKDCFCAPHSKNVQCASKNFLWIPEDIPTDTIELNLNQNFFRNTDLTRRNFTRLSGLQNLFLSDCGIETIAVDTFIDMEHLAWLDLSKNKIQFIADFTFRNLVLKHLFLNDNIGVQFSLGAFAGLTTQGLYLNNCGLKRLPVDLFSPLKGSLKILWIHKNNIESFNPKWKYLFKSLAHVQLGGNAFHCNCDIRWLYTYFQSTKNVLFAEGDQPQCASPAHLKGKTFEQLSEADFRCQLPTFENLDAVFDAKMGKLTCHARGDPAPTLHWISPDGTTETYYPSDLDKQNHENMGILVITGLKLEKKDAFKCVASNPAGNVTFALNIAWPDLRPATPKTTIGNNVIRDRTTPNPRRRGFNNNNNNNNKNFAGDDSGVYKWADVKSESSKLTPRDNNVRYESTEDDEHHFTIIDIVGAVVGTFILTLLLCITAFHYYHKKREQVLRDEDHHYSMPDEVNNKRTPPEVFIMNEPDDNRIKMINHNNSSEYPT